MYTIWVRIDETLPWIELKGTYQSKNEARKAARQILDRTEIKIASIPDQKESEKLLATIRTHQ